MYSFKKHKKKEVKMRMLFNIVLVMVISLLFASNTNAAGVCGIPQKYMDRVDIQTAIYNIKQGMAGVYLNQNINPWDNSSPNYNEIFINNEDEDYKITASILSKPLRQRSSFFKNIKNQKPQDMNFIHLSLLFTSKKTKINGFSLLVKLTYEKSVTSKFEQIMVTPYNLGQEINLSPEEIIHILKSIAKLIKPTKQTILQLAKTRVETYQDTVQYTESSRTHEKKGTH